MTPTSISLKSLALRILLVAFALAVNSASVAAQQLIATIPAGTNPYAATVNPATDMIYVPNYSTNTVTVIDGTTLGPTTVSVGSGPYFAAVNPMSNKIYVTNSGSNSVTVLDGTNSSLITTITVGTFPYSLAVNATTNRIYVGNLASDNVSVIDGTNDSVIKTVAVGATPFWLAVNPLTDKIYVANSSSNNVTVIGGTNNSVVKTVPAGNSPNFLAINTLTNKIYVANLGSSNVTVIDGSNDSFFDTVPAGSSPYSLAVNSVTNTIYVANSNSNTVTVIDGKDDSQKTVPAGSGPYSLAVNPVTNQIYVGNALVNTVTVIDGVSLTTKTVTVGNGPEFPAVNPATNKVYVPNNGDGTISVIAGANATALQLVPVAPCRLADTRTNHSPIQGGTSMAFNVPQLGNCGIPSTAAGYSLNVTVVPQGALGYLTIWPTGEDQPRVSTMNSLDGRIKANAAIVPAGYQGAVSVYASNTTDVVLDIDGYFAPVSNSTLAFYSLTPCRVADTRNPNGQLGGPYLKAAQERDFPVPASACNIPSTAQAYSLNFTAVPRVGALGYLTVWPLGQSRPTVSTLNAPTGVVTANAAIVPAGYIGNIAAYATNDTDLVIDVNGYFAPAGAGGLSLYPTAPCRLLDTRLTGGSFSGTIGSDVGDSVCEPPETAEAYVFNATVVPVGPLGYLSLWPNGQAQPVVSTLNASDGSITSNMAIVPTANGSIDAFASNPTQLILDMSSYFAP